MSGSPEKCLGIARVYPSNDCELAMCTKTESVQIKTVYSQVRSAQHDVSDVIILVCPSMNGPSKANSVEIEIMRT